MSDRQSSLITATTKKRLQLAESGVAQVSQIAPVVCTEVRIKGQTRFVPSVAIGSRNVIVNGKWLKTATIQDEELVEDELLVDPDSFVRELTRTKLNADIFTFAQKMPDITPKHAYKVEWENFAVIPITRFSEWWEKKVEPSVRRAVRKAVKSGIIVRSVPFSDELVRGIVAINNETPVRQGRRFWHFQKNFEAVKHENSTYDARNEFIGAYYQDELVGFVRITYADKVANIVQLLCMTKHYDKRPANALIAKAVEVSEQRGMSYLLYYNYIYNDPQSSLTEFKRRSGFEMVLLPRYYVPLTVKGKIALKVGVHRGLVKSIPKPLLSRLLKARGQWNMRRLKAAEGTI